MLAKTVSDLAFALRLGVLAQEENWLGETGGSRRVAKTQRFANIRKDFSFQSKHQL
jgi:hypothetical protein